MRIYDTICAEERMALICFDHILRDERRQGFHSPRKEYQCFVFCFVFSLQMKERRERWKKPPGLQLIKAEKMKEGWKVQELNPRSSISSLSSPLCHDLRNVCVFDGRLGRGKSSSRNTRTAPVRLNTHFSERTDLPRFRPRSPSPRL